jgi:gamma-glutamylcyclotransferase (GGCT)/AIG2-like uncharacterized protein YtfP
LPTLNSTIALLDWQVPLFVYGTLKSTALTAESAQLLAGARCLGQARCQGRLVLVDYYPGLIQSLRGTDWVEGELYQLQSAAQLVALDHYEGCGRNDPIPTEFVRVLSQVQQGDAVLQAWVYWYNRDSAALPKIAHFPT